MVPPLGDAVRFESARRDGEPSFREVEEADERAHRALPREGEDAVDPEVENGRRVRAVEMRGGATPRDDVPKAREDLRLDASGGVTARGPGPVHAWAMHPAAIMLQVFVGFVGMIVEEAQSSPM